jgi:hypothetical protein
VPTKSRSKKQSLKTFSTKEWRAKRKRLRELGILIRRTDLRKPVSPHQKRIIAEYSDVLEHRATVLDAGTAARAKRAAGELRRRGSKIIVPRAPGDRIRLSKEGDIIVKAKIYGATITRRPVSEVAARGARKPSGADIKYAIDFHRGGYAPETFRFNTWKELTDFMDRYSNRRAKPWRNWRRYAWQETVKRD